MKEIKITAYQVEGYAVTVDIEGNLAEYAKSFLHIFNNVRENEELFGIRNYYGSSEVTVYCDKESKDNLIKYLKAFGEIKSCDKVLIQQVEEPSYNLDKYYDAIVVQI